MGKAASGPGPATLSGLLEQARTASPNARIELRDAIASHGAAAITSGLGACAAGRVDTCGRPLVSGER